MTTKPKLVVTTVVSADSFQYYIPIFIYTWLRAYPNAIVKVYLRGKLNADVITTLDLIDEQESFIIEEDSFLDFPTRESTCNTLRHLIPEDEFEGFDYLYITDIDFIALRHNPSHLDYFAENMSRTKLPYASFRGPFRKPYRPNISKAGWKGKFRRVVDGTLMLKIPEWYDATRKQRQHYWDVLLSGGNDGIDTHPSCSYREYNEVMMYRICSKSKIKTPKTRRCFPNGDIFSVKYRDIHLGDFKFKHRQTNHKYLEKKIKIENIRQFIVLEQDPLWREICKICCKDEMVGGVMKHLRKYVEERG